MNYETARTALAGLMEAALTAYPTLAVSWDNTPIDLSKAGDLALQIEYMWDDAGQIDLGLAPNHRTTGSLFLTIFAKAGTGTVKALQLMDTLTLQLKCKSVSGLVTTVPKPGKKPERSGWKTQELHVPFYFDSTS
ncbi:phage tail terminator-like protein [Ferribacterium limneticum]|uniref:phage tail terminator-like protein n=1 Tax=Ferribacterium limneticum TaxID=76259 RepID=UPI001CF81E49|nr:phage tail terminator-like protein [Ferribacterium limneticum]UCV26799.1 hypothetical protein KI617_10800 [Ferribacterium limneticum]UCV30716.1 hypothetical protein KI608_10800 [Ferribacterium limneticum]